MKALIITALLVMALAGQAQGAGFFQDLQLTTEGEYRFNSTYQGPEHTSTITLEGEGKAALQYRQAIIEEVNKPKWWDLF